MRSFLVEFSGEVYIDLDEKVIDVVDDKWREKLYDLHTPEDIAKHIAYNMVFNKWPLSSLDGWADQPNENAQITEVDIYGLEAQETTEETPS